jgi:hypothetical protein
VNIKIIDQVCLQGSELKKIIYLGFVPSGVTEQRGCSSDFVLKTLERASDLKMLISFSFFVCLSFL